MSLQGLQPLTSSGVNLLSTATGWICWPNAVKQLDSCRAERDCSGLRGTVAAVTSTGLRLVEGQENG